MISSEIGAPPPPTSWENKYNATSYDMDHEPIWPNPISRISNPQTRFPTKESGIIIVSLKKILLTLLFSRIINLKYVQTIK